MKRLALLFLLFPVPLFAQQATPAPDMTISANAATNFTLYQGWPLIVDVTIMNSLRLQGGGAPSLLVSPQTGAWTDAIQLTATSSSGTTQQWPFRLIGSPATSTLTLSPTNYVIAIWQLSSSDTLALVPDTYQLTATIQINNDSGWSGTVSTSPITIQVSPEPTLTSDQQQLKALLTAQYQTNAGDLGGALTTVQQYLALNPTDPIGMSAAANLLELLGYPDLAYFYALAAVNAFAQADPTPVEAPSNLLTMYQRLFTYMATPPNMTAAVTTTTGAAASIGYSSANQTITLSATVTSPSSAVNEGTVTLTVSGVGSPVSATVLEGIATASYTIPGGTPAGNYALQANYNGTPNFQPSGATSQLTIAPTPLTVTANSTSRQYGQPNAAFTASYNGFASGDSGSTLQGTLACTTTATQSSPVGSYLIACSGVSSPNYLITFVPGTLTITPAPLTITAISASRQYGQPNPLFGASYSGFVNGDTASALSGTLACTSSATPSSPVIGSPYAIKCSGQGSTNYAINYVPGQLMVTPVPLSITAHDATKILNAPLPTFSATYSGFVNGENPSVLSGVLTCTTSATAASSVGIYAITCSGQASTNYSIGYKSGSLTIIYEPDGICDGSPGHQILPPINVDGSSLYQQGRTVPAKFRVCDVNGVSIGTPGVVSSFFLTGVVSGTTTTAMENVVDTNNPDTAFRWDPTGQQWIFNISTGNLTAGNTHIFTIALSDGSTIMFQFGLR